MRLFKSRVLYIVLLIISTLVIAAVITLRFAIPTGPSFPQEGMSFQGRSSSFRIVRSILPPVVIVCVLIDAFCIFMLIRLSKKKLKEAAVTPAGGEADASCSHRGRSRKLWILFLVPVVIIALLLNTLTYFKEKSTSQVTVNEKVLTADAVAKKISSVFLSGGTLTEDNSSGYSLPGSIRIESYSVTNGDMVNAGDLIATVNKASVMNQIKEIRDLINDLDGELKTL